mgnify:FL=1
MNLRDLKAVRGAWLTNSVRGVRAIKEIRDERDGSKDALWKAPDESLLQERQRELQERLFGERTEE